jgi:uncharacterized repeat protein (TIGR01451 family)
MKKGKIGTIFMVSVLALAGIGAAYAGLTDTIYIFGSVQTANVEFDIDYSGTWVWKVYPHDIHVTDDPNVIYTEDQGELVAWGHGRPPDYDGIDDDDPLMPDGTTPYDAVIEFHNLFPCIEFRADILFHYVGSIPCKVTDLTYEWTTDDEVDTDGDGIPDENFFGHLEQMWIDTGGQYGMWGGFFRYDPATGDIGEEVVVGTQLHYCDYVILIVIIHLPQDNIYQGLSGTGYMDIGIMQWNDECGEPEPEADIEVVKFVDNDQPTVGDEIIYQIRVHNLGPDPATGVEVTDFLPAQLDYATHTETQGSYDPNTGVWDVGYLPVCHPEWLNITAEVTSAVGTGELTQLVMILDGSGSIPDADWTVIKNGLAYAIRNCFPDDESVELTVIQFGGNGATGTGIERAIVEVPSTVVSAANKEGTATTIEGIAQLKGMTPMHLAFDLALSELLASPNHPSNGGTFDRQVVNLVTDGNPNTYDGDTEDEDFQLAEDARDLLVATFSGADNDELDVEAVGNNIDINWLLTEIAWPQPGYNDWPPSGPGWVRQVDDADEFADTICEKFAYLFEEIDNTATRTASSPTDPNPYNDESSVTIYPQPP